MNYFTIEDDSVAIKKRRNHLIKDPIAFHLDKININNDLKQEHFSERFFRGLCHACLTCLEEIRKFKNLRLDSALNICYNLSVNRSVKV